MWWHPGGHLWSSHLCSFTVLAILFVGHADILRSVADYSVEFRILAAESGWNDEALRGIYMHGLNEQFKDELAVRDETNSLDSLVDLADKVRQSHAGETQRKELQFPDFREPPCCVIHSRESRSQCFSHLLPLAPAHPLRPRNPCSSAEQIFLLPNARGEYRRVSAYTVAKLVTSWLPVLLSQKTVLISSSGGTGERD